MSVTFFHFSLRITSGCVPSTSHTTSLNPMKKCPPVDHTVLESSSDVPIFFRKWIPSTLESPLFYAEVCWLFVIQIYFRPLVAICNNDNFKSLHVTRQLYSQCHNCHSMRQNLLQSDDQGPISKMIYHCNLNSMEILFCSHPSCSKVITTKFCTWQNYAKFYSDVIPCNGVAL